MYARLYLYAVNVLSSTYYTKYMLRSICIFNWLKFHFQIIPIEGSKKVNGEDQKTFGEILHEVIISK